MNVVTSKQNKALVMNIDLSFFPPPGLRWMKIATSASLTKLTLPATNPSSKIFLSFYINQNFFPFCFIIYFNFDPTQGKCLFK